MSMLGGLFGGKEQHPNFERVAHALRNHLGFNTLPPSSDVLAVLDQLTPRELLNFDNMHSLQGMEALFRARSLHVDVDPEGSTATISFASAGDSPTESAPQPEHKPVLSLSAHHTTYHVEPPKDTGSVIRTSTSTMAIPAESLGSVPKAFEHLEAFEHLTQQVVDLLMRNGRINTGDKDVLKKIRPLDNSLNGRLTALERWKTELTRRIRGLSVPKVAERVALGGGQTQQAESEDSIARRFETLLIWTSKLIKAIEHEGLKFHNKPMWLPH